jgi:murein DD-endopeptidase MepM/ murein hydrolase activator NlpD
MDRLQSTSLRRFSALVALAVLAASLGAQTAAPTTTAAFEPLGVPEALGPLTAPGAADVAAPPAAEGERVSRLGPRRDAFLAWPSAGPLESPFGPRWGREHQGIDIDGETGDPVRAAESGVVISAEHDGGYGLTVRVVHSGRFRGLMTVYAHLSSAVVRPRQRVTRGQALGRIGTSGSVTGSHLHFEVWRPHRPVDPMRLLVGRGGGSA